MKKPRTYSDLAAAPYVFSVEKCTDGVFIFIRSEISDSVGDDSYTAWGNNLREALKALDEYWPIIVTYYSTHRAVNDDQPPTDSITPCDPSPCPNPCTPAKVTALTIAKGRALAAAPRAPQPQTRLTLWLSRFEQACDATVRAVVTAAVITYHLGRVTGGAVHGMSGALGKRAGLMVAGV